jgi:hypothetical protein
MSEYLRYILLVIDTQLEFPFPEEICRRLIP